MNRTVLVVEDEPDLLELTRMTLEVHGYEILEASSGAEALSLFESRKVDAVLLDIGLPDMSGWQVLERLRASQRGSEVHVVILSAFAGHDVEAKARALRSGYVLKPFHPREIIAALVEDRAAPA